MPKKSFTKDEMEKYTHQYSYEIKLIQHCFNSTVEQILSHLFLSKVHYPDGQPMLQRISLATKALGTPKDGKETANQFITALCKQLFGKAHRQTDVRRTMNRYKFRFVELPIISDYLLTKKRKGKVSLKPLKVHTEQVEKKPETKEELNDEQKSGKNEKPPKEPGKKEASEFKPDSPKTVSAQEIKARDKIILRLAWSILDRNRPMLTESAIMGADFILGRLEEELIRQHTIDGF